MYIELKCHSCQQVFRVDFSKDEYSCDRCPKCGAIISSTDVSRLHHLTESFFSDGSRTNSVEVCGLYANTSNTAITDADLFSADLEQLSKLYNGASPEVRTRLVALMDQFYLLVNSDVRKNNTNNLDVTLEALRNLFSAKIKKIHDELALDLGIEQESDIII